MSGFSPQRCGIVADVYITGSDYIKSYTVFYGGPLGPFQLPTSGNCNFQLPPSNFQIYYLHYKITGVWCVCLCVCVCVGRLWHHAMLPYPHSCATIGQLFDPSHRHATPPTETRGHRLVPRHLGPRETKTLHNESAPPVCTVGEQLQCLGMSRTFRGPPDSQDNTWC